MTADVTVVCSAWHKQQDMDLFHRQHLAALLNQTIPVNVIYVCDGGSSLPKHDDRVEIISTTKPISTAEAFMMALAMTDTEYFAALNLDDHYFRDGLALQVGIMKQQGLDMVCGDWEIRFTKESDTSRVSMPIGALRPCRSWPPEQEAGIRLGSGDAARGTFGPAPVFRTQAVRDVGGYARSFGDGTPVKTIIDFILWDRLRQAGKKSARAMAVVGSYYSSPATQQEFRGDGNAGVAAEHAAYRRHGARA